MSVYDDTLDVVMERLGGSPAITGDLRRSHLVPTVPENCPATYVVDGHDTPGADKGDCRTERTGEFTVTGFFRGDDVKAAVATWKQGVMERLDPLAEGSPTYPATVDLKPGRITPRTEEADADATRIEMEFSFDYFAKRFSLMAAS